MTDADVLDVTTRDLLGYMFGTYPERQEDLRCPLTDAQALAALAHFVGQFMRFHNLPNEVEYVLVRWVGLVIGNFTLFWVTAFLSRALAALKVWIRAYVVHPFTYPSVLEIHALRARVAVGYG